MPSKQVWAHLLSQSKLPFPQARGQVVLPARSCALSVRAGEAVIWLLTLPSSSLSSMTAALHSWLGLVLWAGCSERGSGLLLGAWDHTVPQKNSILSLVQCPPVMPMSPLAAGAGSAGAAERGLEHCQHAPRADRQLLQLQGQLFWFSSSSSFREPRSLAAMGSSLSCSSFFLFERGAEILGETVGAKLSSQFSPDKFSIKTTSKSHSLGDKLCSVVSAPPGQVSLPWGAG